MQERPQLTAEQIRVLGCLVEKSITTPEQYPLTVNALKNACNQKTSRYPVVTYDDTIVIHTLRDLIELKAVIECGLTSGRVRHYEHRMRRFLDIDHAEMALLTVLMLRGPQTVGEIRTNSGRMHKFETIADVQDTIATLQAREADPLIVLLPRLTGKKEPRYAHTLEGKEAIQQLQEQAAAASPATTSVTRHTIDSEQAVQIKTLNNEVAALREEIAELKARIAVLETGAYPDS